MNEFILDLAAKRVVLLDGGMGTELIKRGFPMGACPESWNFEKPETIVDIHRSYFQAGSDAVLTNSFGGTPIKLAAYDLEKRCVEINRKSAELARTVCPEQGYVGGSMGPTGKFLLPQGEYTEEQFEAAYEAQARGLAAGGVDFLLIETQYNLKEALCALRASLRAAPRLPVFVTMTFNRTPRGFFTIMGDDFQKFSTAAAAGGASAVGANCTLGSREMAELAVEMGETAELPIIAQANAGRPEARPDGTVYYSQSPEDYVSSVPAMLEAGVVLLGGCCGTGPSHVRKMADIVKPG